MTPSLNFCYNLCVKDRNSFASLRNRYHEQILASKKQYYSNLVSSSSDNPRSLWQTINHLLPVSYTHLTLPTNREV